MSILTTHPAQADRLITCPVLQVNLLLIAGTGIAAFSLLRLHGMHFDAASAVAAIATIVLLTPFSIVFQHRGIATFASLLTGFQCMVAFNVCLSVLTYACTPLAAPLADAWLIRVDEALGIHLPAIVAWAQQHPALYTVLNLAYPSVMFSTLLAMVVLGLNDDRWKLQSFVLHFMISGLLTTLFFCLFPAEGPFAVYDYPARPDQQRFLTHFHALRNGQFPVVSLTNVEGLITFPSFHTSWAILLAWGFRHYRWLRVPMLFLNLTVVASTLTTGWHYGSDVLGGLLVAALSIATTEQLRKRIAL
jgi:membrane-associated phospholipid phosphatase